MEKIKRILIVLLMVIVVMHMQVLSSHAANSYQLYLEIKSEGNLIFDKYDMEICIDGKVTGTVANGETFTGLTTVTAGDHELKIRNVQNESMYATKTISVNQDITFRCTVAHSSSISIKNIETENNVAGAYLPVPDVTGEILRDAKNQLKEAGFINISYTGDSGSIFDDTNWTVVSQGIKAGTTADKNEPFVLSCRKTDVILSERFVGMDCSRVPASAKEIGYSVTYVNGITYDNNTTDINQLTNEQRKEWVVQEISHISGQGKSARATILFTGQVEMPDLVGMILKDARISLEKLECSSVEIKADDNSHIWGESNWEVIDQSIKAGDKIKATDEITLIARHIEPQSTSSSSSSTSTSGNVSENSSSSSAGSNTAEVETVEKTEKEIAEELERYLPKDTAKKAIVIAFTNHLSEDIYLDENEAENTSDVEDEADTEDIDEEAEDSDEKVEEIAESVDDDGSLVEDEADQRPAYDPEKFHDYSYYGEYYAKISREGEWTAKDETTWRVEDIYLRNSNLNIVIKASFDLTFDDEHYTISNGSYVQGDLEEVYSEETTSTLELMDLNPEEQPYLIVSVEQVTAERPHPVMEGSSLEAVMEVAESFGMVKAYSDEGMHGILVRSLTSLDGSLTLDVGYTFAGKEICFGHIVTFNNASPEDQLLFIKSMAKVLCPEDSAEEVPAWVNENIGSEADTTIDGFNYELSFGPNDNALYDAGMSNWDEWDTSFD